jgi:formylglycine-generating enzyme required for sulfatase activity
MRGGSWTDDPKDLRAAYRSGSLPFSRGSILGLRVGRALAR